MDGVVVVVTCTLESQAMPRLMRTRQLHLRGSATCKIPAVVAALDVGTRVTGCRSRPQHSQLSSMPNQAAVVAVRMILTVGKMKNALILAIALALTADKEDKSGNSRDQYPTQITTVATNSNGKHQVAGLCI